MDVDSLVNELTLYGLTNHEAKVCVSLIQEEKQSARKIALDTGIARPDVYRVLRNLKEKQLVVEHFGRPRIYETLQPNDLLESMTVKQEDLAKKLREKQPHLAERLSSITGSRPEAESEEFFLLIKSVPVIVDKVHELIERTEEELLVMLDTQALSLHEEYALGEKVKAVVDKGVKARMLTTVDAGNMNYVKELLDRYEVRHHDYIPFIMRIHDARYLLIGATIPFIESYKEKTNIYTNNREFLAATRSNFFQIWDHCIDAEMQIRKLGNETII